MGTTNLGLNGPIGQSGPTSKVLQNNLRLLVDRIHSSSTCPSNILPGFLLDVLLLSFSFVWKVLKGLHGQRTLRP